MIPRTTYPHRNRRSPRPCPRHYPRRHKRGLAALAGTLFLAGILLNLSALWAISQARQQRAGEAALVAEAAARQGYGLHHWLHEAREGAWFTTPAEGQARALGPAEQTALETHGAWPGWVQPSRRWDIIPMISTPSGQEWDTPLPHGILIVRPLDGCGEPRDERLRGDVAQRLGVALGGTPQAPDPTAAGPAVDLVTANTCDLVVFAHAFSRTDPTLVLRQPRAGFAPPVMVTDLDMGGNDITGADVLAVNRTLTIGTDVGAVQADKIIGSVAVETDMTVGTAGPTPAPAPGFEATLVVGDTTTLTTLGTAGNPVEIETTPYGAIDRIPGPGSAPDLTVERKFFCGNPCDGGTVP